MAETLVRELLQGYSKRKLIVKTAALTLLAGAIAAMAGGLLFMESGVYPIAANRPHFAPVRWMLETGKTRSVQLHSRGVQAREIRDPSLFKHGFVLYRKNCQPCHGAPGVPSDAIGIGINPKPPQLVTVGVHWSEPELYWITTHGLKMSGMPAFSSTLSDEDRWAIVAFLRRLSRMTPADYQGAAAAVDQGTEPSSWGIDDDSGFARIKSANRDSGRRLLAYYGCTSCHTVPEIGAGLVGPPLTAYAERQYVAGFLVNVPTNTINWIMHPKQYKPQTAMPELNVTAQDAANIAAYLYSLGDQRRIDVLQQTTAHQQ